MACSSTDQYPDHEPARGLQFEHRRTLRNSKSDCAPLNRAFADSYSN